MTKRPIYFDYMATTPVDPAVKEAMLPYLEKEGAFGNPASVTHCYGKEAAQAVDRAREQVAAAIGATPMEVCFTSGATEANNLALFGATGMYQRKGRHIIAMETEHKSVLDCLNALEKKQFEITLLPPQQDGLVDLAALDEAIRDDTILVSIMHVNNEIGVIQPIQAVGELLKGKGILLHVDSAQSLGKCPVDVNSLGVDLLSVSAHKCYGPKGIGALYVRHQPRRIRLQPQLLGGGHENGLRSGTLPTHQIVGMGEALRIASAVREAEQARIKQLRDLLWNSIKDNPRVHLNGHPEKRVPNNLNISFEGVDGANLISLLPELAVSSTSACMAASTSPSYVLKAIGVSHRLAQASIRLSIGRYTTKADIETAIHAIQRLLAQ